VPALVIVVLLALFGAALVIGGVYVLAGSGASLLIAGLMLFAAAAFVRSGMTPNG